MTTSAAGHDAISLGPGAPVLVFDVGGTDIKSAVVDGEGRLRDILRTPTPAPGERIAERLIDTLGELAETHRAASPEITPQAVGLLVPGIVDEHTGLGVFSSNMGWRDAPIRALAAARFDVPVAFGHDVGGAAWAEYTLGSTKNLDDVVVLLIGTGISGTVILDGQVRSGHGYAGEFGHSPLGEWPCACGARGCLEAIASAGAIARRYTEATGTAVPGAQEVIARAQAGDSDAIRVWNEALDTLAMSLSQITAMIAPQAIVIAGGLSRAGDALFPELRARLADRLSFHRIPDLVPAALEGDAGLWGSAIRARKAIA